MKIEYNKDIRGVYIVKTSQYPLMVRAEPNTDGEVIAEIPKNASGKTQYNKLQDKVKE